MDVITSHTVLIKVLMRSLWIYYYDLDHVYIHRTHINWLHTIHISLISFSVFSDVQRSVLSVWNARHEHHKIGSFLHEQVPHTLRYSQHTRQCYRTDQRLHALHEATLHTGHHRHHQIPRLEQGLLRIWQRRRKVWQKTKVIYTYIYAHRHIQNIWNFIRFCCVRFCQNHDGSCCTFFSEHEVKWSKGLYFQNLRTN